MHDVPTLPWTHVSSDIFEWHNKHYIVTTDSYSGWYEIDPLTDLRTTSVINKLKRSFSTHGVLIELQTVNGTQHVSEQFREYTIMIETTNMLKALYFLFLRQISIVYVKIKVSQNFFFNFVLNDIYIYRLFIFRVTIISPILINV